MNESALHHWRQALLDALDRLKEQDALGAEGTRTVSLDQQSVGRLSRMDALQQQSMAKATQARRAAAEARIRAALLRIEEGEFGYCTDCGEEIAKARLKLDPAIPTCITCARG